MVSAGRGPVKVTRKITSLAFPKWVALADIAVIVPEALAAAGDAVAMMTVGTVHAAAFRMVRRSTSRERPSDGTSLMLTMKYSPRLCGSGRRRCAQVHQR